MIPVAEYRRLHEQQKTVFDGGVRAWNAVQTNLTILPAALLDYLETGGFFDGVGVSFDVHGDQRVDTRGRSSTHKVLTNLQRLIASQVRFRRDHRPGAQHPAPPFGRSWISTTG